MRKQCFTLTELLVVIIIISILMVSLIVGGGAVLNAANKTKAQQTANKLKLACELYLQEYKKLPFIKGGELQQTGMLVPSGSDATNDGSEYRKLLLILSNQLEKVADRKAYNPRSKVFWEPNADFKEKGLLDPWGNPFVIWFDNDADGYAGEKKSGSGVSNRSAAGKVHVISYGPEYEDVKSFPTITTDREDIVATFEKTTK